MKTVKDLYDKHKEWPSMMANMCTWHNGEFHFQNSESFNSWPVVCTYPTYKKYKEEQESKDITEDVNTWTKEQLVNTAIKVNNDEEGKAAVEFYESKGFTVWDGSSIKNNEYGSYVMTDDEDDIVSWSELGIHSLIKPTLPTNGNTTQDSKVSWYDYAKQEWNGKNIPDKGSVVLLNDSTVSVELHDNKLLDQVCVRHQNGELSIPKIYWLKPLDYDKYSKKVVTMGWGVKSGIDFEVSEDKKVWFTVKLIEINNNGNFYDGIETWKYCRPRMNHKHVLDGVQFSRIPSCFAIEILYTFDESYVVEFTGLKDGYVFEYDM